MKPEFFAICTAGGNLLIKIMFDKFKQLAQLKGLQDAIKNETAVVEKNGVRVTVKGDFSVSRIEILKDLTKEDLEQEIKNCINEAFKKVQMAAASRLSGLI